MYHRCPSNVTPLCCQMTIFPAWTRFRTYIYYSYLMTKHKFNFLFDFLFTPITTCKTSVGTQSHTDTHIKTYSWTSACIFNVVFFNIILFTLYFSINVYYIVRYNTLASITQWTQNLKKADWNTAEQRSIYNQSQGFSISLTLKCSLYFIHFCRELLT